MTTRVLTSGTVGWQAPDPWFPEDLPEEWRLAYYANEYRAIWVPPAVWRTGRLPDVRAWREDVGEDFRFVVEFDADLPAAVAEALAPLGEQLHAVVAPQGHPCDEVLRECVPACRWLTPESVYRGEAGEGPAGIARLNRAQLSTPRAMREQIEAFMAGHGEPAPLLFIEGSIGLLDDVRTLARLMGLC